MPHYRTNCRSFSVNFSFKLCKIFWKRGLEQLISSQYSKKRDFLVTRQEHSTIWWRRSPSIWLSGWSWQNREFLLEKWESSLSVRKRPESYMAWIEALFSSKLLFPQVVQRSCRLERDIKIGSIFSQLDLPEVLNIEFNKTLKGLLGWRIWEQKEMVGKIVLKAQFLDML